MNFSFLQSPSRKGRAVWCGGFSLLEVVVVLGVIGVITAGIFAAASFANRRISINTASDQLSQTAINIRALYSGRNVSYGALTPPSSPNFTSDNPGLVRQGAFPVDMLTPRPAAGAAIGAGTVANHVWGQSANGTAQAALAGTSGNPVRFVVRFTGVPADACADLVMRTSLPGRETGLTRIDVGSTTVGSVDQRTYQSSSSSTVMPVPAINASNACAGSGPFTIDWYYNLGT